jgi:UDP-N-acetylmuramoyl-L-alanyl-D-glutamate--2,6-diaminopimelate ligase
MGSGTIYYHLIFFVAVLMKILKDILSNILSIDPSFAELEVTSLELDSRLVKSGSLFIAIPGYNSDGRDYLNEAVAAGAVVCLVEKEGFHQPAQFAVPILAIENLYKYISKIAANFYSCPSQNMAAVGITGTNGKTSCAHFLAQALQAIKIPTAVMGTVGNGVWPDLVDSSLTTVDAITLQSQLADVKDKAKVVVIEVSSHALVQRRVAAVEFAVAAFTNLTHEHLDYHGDMDEYAKAKFSLFSSYGVRCGVVNLDDPCGRRLLDSVSLDNWIGISCDSDEDFPVPMVSAKNINYLAQGIQFTLLTPWGKAQLSLPLLGSFNVTNVLTVVAILAALNIPFDDILLGIRQLTNAAGRMQLFYKDNKPTIIVDYAHTPDALEKALQSLRLHSAGDIFCVFGCGGDRDKAKRPLMGKIAQRLADKVIITEDNSRGEKFASIAEDICEKISVEKDVYCIQDRVAAINYAVQSAKPGDMVLLAGKGHETALVIGDKKIAHSDIKYTEEILANDELERTYE